jgi:hypothetical protein
MYLNCRQADNELFSTSLYELDCIINKKKATYSNIVSIVLIKEDLSRFPTTYTWFIDIFSKLVLDQFLLYRSYDYKIVLESNKKELTYSPLYKISAKELEATKQYLLENLDKGFIEASQVPFAAPVLFVKKPNRSLWFYIDYHKLNSLNRKD